MWRPVRKGELRYMRRMEERIWKQRMLDRLFLAALFLMMVLLLTHSAKLKEEGRMVNSYISDTIVDGFVDLLKNTGNPDYKPQLEGNREGLEAAQRRLETAYYWIYGLECLLTLGTYICYGRSSLQKVRGILEGPLLVQHAVCTGKREYRSRYSIRIYLNIKTESDEKLNNILVPSLVGSKLECDMPVLAVKYTQAGEEKEEVSYKLYPVKVKSSGQCPKES